MRRNSRASGASGACRNRLWISAGSGDFAICCPHSRMTIRQSRYAKATRHSMNFRSAPAFPACRGCSPSIRD